MSEIDPQKLELLRTAMPKGLSAGDGGLTQSRSTSVSVASFPQFSSKVSESKLYTPTLEQASIPEVASDQAQSTIAPQPWNLIARIDPDGEDQYLITVQAGTLNGILPSNWDIEFTAQSEGIYYAKALISTNGSEITGVTIGIDASPPVVQEPLEFAIENNVEYLFGVFSEGKALRTIAAGNISLLPKIWLTIPADPVREIGQSPYDQYYLLS